MKPGHTGWVELGGKKTWLPYSGDLIANQDVRFSARERRRTAGAFSLPVHASRVYSLSLRSTGDVIAAENLTRDIFIEAFTCLDTVGDDSAFAARLYCRAAKKLLANGPKAATLKASGINSDRISISVSSGGENWPHILSRSMKL